MAEFSPDLPGLNRDLSPYTAREQTPRAQKVRLREFWHNILRRKDVAVVPETRKQRERYLVTFMDWMRNVLAQRLERRRGLQTSRVNKDARTDVQAYAIADMAINLALRGESKHALRKAKHRQLNQRWRRMYQNRTAQV